MLGFICNNMRVSDGNKCKDGGLRRCTEERVVKILSDLMRIYLSDTWNRFYHAANRLKTKKNYEAHNFIQLISIFIVHVT